MRFMARRGARNAEGDMTPMIDMTFQLIAFFMVVINFSEMDQNEAIRLPSSELAKPPDQPPPSPITLQVTDKGEVILGPYISTVADLHNVLALEKNLLPAGKTVADTTVIIRADQKAKTGVVQEVIQVCQKLGFEKFALRAKEETKAKVLPAGST